MGEIYIFHSLRTYLSAKKLWLVNKLVKFKSMFIRAFERLRIAMKKLSFWISKLGFLVCRYDLKIIFINKGVILTKKIRTIKMAILKIAKNIYHKESLIKNYIIPFFVGFSLLMLLLHFFFQDYSIDNTRTVIGILISANIAILALVFGILFIIVQFTGEQYSPRTIAMVIFKSPYTIFIIGANLFSICFGIILLGNKLIIGNPKIFNIFVSLSITVISSAFFFLNRLTYLIRPDYVTSVITKEIGRYLKPFLSNITTLYKNDIVRYPLNITTEYDLLVPLFNITERAMTNHDLSTVMDALKKLEGIIESFYSIPNMTQDNAVALTQYMGMHLTRMVEIIPTIHEDDIYQDIFKIQNLLVIKNSENKFFEAYKWCMVTYYYTLKLIKQEESDYPLRIAIFNVSKLVDLKKIYDEEQLPLFIDLLNYLACITTAPEETFAPEPLEQWLMGMKSKKEAVINIYTQLCEKMGNASKAPLIEIYLQKLFERLILFKDFFIKEQIKNHIETIMKYQNKESKEEILLGCVNKIMAAYPTQDGIADLKNMILSLTKNKRDPKS